jgi:hypothetical protein
VISKSGRPSRARSRNRRTLAYLSNASGAELGEEAADLESAFRGRRDRQRLNRDLPLSLDSEVLP